MSGAPAALALLRCGPCESLPSAAVRGRVRVWMRSRVRVRIRGRSRNSGIVRDRAAACCRHCPSSGGCSPLNASCLVRRSVRGGGRARARAGVRVKVRVPCSLAPLPPSPLLHRCSHVGHSHLVRVSGQWEESGVRFKV